MHDTRCLYGNGEQDMATCPMIYIHCPGYYPTTSSYHHALKHLCPNRKARRVKNPNLLIYAIKQGILFQMIQTGKGDSPEAACVRKDMEEAWGFLTEEDKEHARVLLVKVQEIYSWYTDLAKVQPIEAPFPKLGAKVC